MTLYEYEQPFHPKQKCQIAKCLLNECSYEIYPHTVNCYTPFEALLAGDITAIIERNKNYCKSYNCGEYTLDKWNERVKSPEMQHYFDVIKSITKGE